MARVETTTFDSAELRRVARERARLEESLSVVRSKVREQVRAGHAAGVKPTDLADMAQVSRYTVYTMLGKIERKGATP